METMIEPSKKYANIEGIINPTTGKLIVYRDDYTCSVHTDFEDMTVEEIIELVEEVCEHGTCCGSHASTCPFAEADTECYWAENTPLGSARYWKHTKKDGGEADED